MANGTSEPVEFNPGFLTEAMQAGFVPHSRLPRSVGYFLLALQRDSEKQVWMLPQVLEPDSEAALMRTVYFPSSGAMKQNDGL